MNENEKRALVAEYQHTAYLVDEIEGYGQRFERAKAMVAAEGINPHARQCRWCAWWVKGECHKRSPMAGGFPKTSDMDFCGDFYVMQPAAGDA